MNLARIVDSGKASRSVDGARYREYAVETGEFTTSFLDYGVTCERTVWADLLARVHHDELENA